MGYVCLLMEQRSNARDCDEENAIDDMGEAEIEYIRMKLVGTEWEPLTEDDSSEYDETFDED